MRLALSHRTGPDRAKDKTMFSPQDVRRSQPASQAQRPLPFQIYPHGLLLLSPLLVAVTVAILLGLLGIFVTWLLIVAALASAIVASDLAHRSFRRFLKRRSLQDRAAGYS
jgi:hypothetical protein